MVSLTEVRSANAALQQSHQYLTAVFVGVTSGIGKATLQGFATNIPKPTAFIVGRSRKTFEPELNHLKTLNPSGEFIFIEADVMLIKSIDAISKYIQSQLNRKTIDLLITSQGYIGFQRTRRERRWSRQVDFAAVLRSCSIRAEPPPVFQQDRKSHLYPRWRQEGKVFEDDLDLVKNYSVGNAMSHFGTLMTLSFDKLAEQNPDKAFPHIFPGLVSTGFFGKSATGVLGVVMRYILEPILSLFASKPAEVGERMLYYATSEAYPKGSWALDSDGTAKEVQVLKGYRSKGLGDKVAEHNGRVFERAVSR